MNQNKMPHDRGDLAEQYVAFAQSIAVDVEPEAAWMDQDKVRDLLMRVRDLLALLGDE